jgi:hypothetical protein
MRVVEQFPAPDTPPRRARRDLLGPQDDGWRVGFVPDRRQGATLVLTVVIAMTPVDARRIGTQMAVLRLGRSAIGQLCILAALTLLVACGAANSQPVLTSADLTGRWSTPNGSWITFSADHRFSAALIDQAPFFIGCRDLSGSGSWQFPGPEGAGLGLTTYPSGSEIVILFTSPVSPLCSMHVVTLTSWEIDPPVGLCLEFDPDSPCTGTPFTKKR